MRITRNKGGRLAIYVESLTEEAALFILCVAPAYREAKRLALCGNRDCLDCSMLLALRGIGRAVSNFIVSDLKVRIESSDTDERTARELVELVNRIKSEEKEP